MQKVMASSTGKRGSSTINRRGAEMMLQTGEGKEEPFLGRPLSWSEKMEGERKTRMRLEGKREVKPKCK